MARVTIRAPKPAFSGAASIEHEARLPTLTNDWARGIVNRKNSKQETDQTVLTITKVLAKRLIVLV